MINSNLSQIRQSLEQLELNFSNSQLRPTLEDVSRCFAEGSEIDPMIYTLLDGDAASRLYAAILLAAIDPAAADKVLAGLSDDATPIRVQHRNGHGNAVVAVRFAAESFRENGEVDGGLVEVAGKLEAWRNEARDNALPETASLLLLLADEPEAARQIVGPLKSSENPVHRFYAACAFSVIDQNEERVVLESLLNDETAIRMLLGDLAMPFAARDVAAALLEGRKLPVENVAGSEEIDTGFFGTIRRIFKK